MQILLIVVACLVALIAACLCSAYVARWVAILLLAHADALEAYRARWASRLNVWQVRAERKAPAPRRARRVERKQMVLPMR